MKHKYNIGQLVELSNGARLYVLQRFVGLPGMPNEYGIGFTESGDTVIRVNEGSLSPVHSPTYRETS